MPRSYSEPRYDPRHDYRTSRGQTYITPPSLNTPPVLTEPPAHIPRSTRIESPPRRPYHGPHFEKGPAQEELWNARGSTQVWDPYQSVRPVAARPETHGRAHSIHQSRVEPRISDPYEKRPNPYTARAAADNAAYKRPSEGHGGIAVEVGTLKNIRVGRNTFPEHSDREGIVHGIELAKAGRRMANTAVQGRAGFEQKYPHGYESEKAIATHARQVQSQKISAANYRTSEKFLETNLQAWEKQRKRRGLSPGRS